MSTDKRAHDFRFAIVDSEASQQVAETLRGLLERSGHLYIMEEVLFFLRELMTNANKANLKKVHFLLHGLDIFQDADYQKGMASFAEDFHARLQEYQEHIRQDSFFTRVQLQELDDSLVVQVRNSGELTRQETERIDNLIEQSRSIRDIAQAYMLFADDSEGAGLGTISIMLMLRSLGLDERAYTFCTDPVEKETVFTIRVPYDAVSEKQAVEISELVAKEIGTLPVFPENLSQLQKLLSANEVQLQEVALVIERDVTLSTEILKIVNSAQYMLPNKVSSISNAVSLIGIKGLNNLLYSFGAQKTLDKKYGRLEELWEHSYRTASYAYHLARTYKMNNRSDDAYIGGILHDLGKILVSHLFPDMLKAISRHCKEMGYGSHLLESLAIGAAHDRIGEEITRGWNFPSVISDMIGYHHRPLLAPEESRDVVELVYLANQLAHLQDSSYFHPGLEVEILKRFSLKNEAQVRELEKSLDQAYRKQQLK